MSAADWNRLHRGLDGMADELRDLPPVALLRWIAERAARYAPRRTGRLAGGIQPRRETTGRAVVTTSRDTLHYAAPMEARDHYMARAAADAEHEAYDLTETEIEQAATRRFQ